MSIVEVERFASDLAANGALRAEAENQANMSSAVPLEDIAAFASSKGYAFTSDELKELTATAGRKLADTELDAVAGGGIVGNLGFTSLLDTIVSFFKGL